MSEGMSDAGMDNEHHTDMAHMIHEPRFGGAFFMAPNQINHVEAIYSLDCGLRVVIFNAMTIPIDASKFGAFAIYQPENEEEWETIRILMPSEDNTMLHSPTVVDYPDGFDIDLYVRFPDSGEPVLFTMKGNS